DRARRAADHRGMGRPAASAPAGAPGAATVGGVGTKERMTVSQQPVPKMVEALGRRHLMLFSGRANPELASEVAGHLGIVCGSVEIKDFANGEIYVRFGESVRGTDAFVIQTHVEPINERIMEQLIMID